MGPSAKFTAVVADLDHPDRIAIFFIKNGDDPGAMDVLERHLAGADGVVGDNHLIHATLHRRKLVGRQRLEVVEVKTEPFGRHHRTRLLDAGPHDFPEGML